MPRIRTIKPEFFSDRRLAVDLTRDQRLFYVGLWKEADDDGRFLADSRRLLGAIFPYDDDLAPSFVTDTLAKLCATGRLVLYEVNNEPYGQLSKFKLHQRINRPTDSHIPPPRLTERSRKRNGRLTASSSLEGEKEGNREREQGAGKGNGNGRDAVGAAVVLFCSQTGATWALKADIATWSESIEKEARFAGLNLRYEITKCTEWHESKGRKPKSPDRAIRNWLERSAEDLAKKKLAASEPDEDDAFIEKLRGELR